MENRKGPGNGGLEKTNDVNQGSDEEAAPLKGPSKEPIDQFDADGDEEKGDDVLSSTAHKCHLTPKKGLIYLIVCGIIIFILFIVIICLLSLSLWPSTYGSVCQSSQCHLLSSQILGRINETIKPCDDFWEFSCGGWLQGNAIPKTKSYWSIGTAEELNVKEKIRTLINTQSVRDEVNSVDLKVQRFYQSCMGLEYIEADKERALKIIIESLGGWEVLRTFRGNEFNLQRTLTTLHGEYRISPFFKIKVISDPRTPTKSIIMITPAGLSLPDKSYYFPAEPDPGMMGLRELYSTTCRNYSNVVLAFRAYAKDVVQLFGARSDVAFKFGQDMYEYEKRIARVTPEPLNLTDPVVNFHIIKVSQLKSKSNAILWDQLLQAIFPQVTVNDLTEVLVPSVKYLEDVSNIISSTDRPVLNNYLIWHLTLKYSMYLQKPFVDLYYIFRKAITGSLEPLPRWEFCVDETLKFFPHAINGLLSENTEQRQQKREKIDTMFENIKASLSRRISESSGIAESWINFAIGKLRLMDIQIGTPIRNNSILVDFYLPIVAQRDYFFTNVISATAFKLKQEQLDLVSLSKDTSTLWAVSENPFAITFIPSANKIVVPESLLQNSLLLTDSNHLPILYGSIGVQLGEAISRAFGPEQGLYLANGALMQEHDPKVQETREMIDSKRVCVSTFFTSIRLDDEPYIERTSMDSLLHLGGIQIAFDAFKILALPSIALPSLDMYTPNALFFIAYAQSQCSSSTLQFHALEHSIFISLSHDHRTKGLLRQMVGFSNAMSCSKSSEMYADFSCGYFI